MAVTNFEAQISSRAVGTQDVQAQAEAMRKLAESIDGLAMKANKVNEHPGFTAFAEKVKSGIGDPLGSAGEAAKAFLEKLGPVGSGVAALAATLVVLGKVGLDAARDLGHFGDQVGDTAVRMGLTTKEVGQFAFAMKYAGGDMSSLEGITRKLSQEIDEGGKNLRALGIEYRELGTGKIRPTSQIVLELSERLKGMPDTFERNAAAVKIMGRGALEVLPDLLELSEGVRRAKELGLGASDEDLQRWQEYHRAVTEADALWERFARKVKEPLAATITILLKDSSGHQYSLEELRDRGVNLGAFAPRTPASDRAAARAAGFGNPTEDAYERNILTARAIDFTSAVEERRRADSAIDRLFANQTLEAKLKAAEKELSDLSVPTKGASSMKDVEDYSAAQRKVDSIKAQIEATKKLTEEQKQLDAAIKAFAEKTSETELSAGERILKQRDELIAQAEKLKRSESEIAKIREDAAKAVNAMAERSVRDFNQFDLGGTPKLVSGADRRNNIFGQNGVLNPFFGYDTEFKNLAKRYQEDEELRNIDISTERFGIMARSGRTLSLMQYRLGPGQEAEAIAATYSERKRLAQELYAYELSTAQTKVERERAFADFKRAEMDAEIEHEIKLAELRRRRIEEFRSEMGSLFDALLGGKSGLQQFATNELRNVGRAAFSNYLTALRSGEAINRQTLFAGGGFFGDLLAGNQSNPLKASTDANTLATVENTAALRAVALSRSGGGGGFVSNFAQKVGGDFSGGGAPWSTSGIASDTGYTSDGVPRYSPENYDDNGIFLGPGATSSHDPSAVGASARGGASNASRAYGYAAAGVGTAFGIYGAITSPSARGRVGSAGAAISSVGAALPQPAGAIVMGIGLATSLFSSLLPDPKQEEAQRIDRLLASSRYEAPTATTYTMDRYGRSFDYNTRGEVRIVFETPIQVNALDAKSINDRALDIADAVSAALDAKMRPELEDHIQRIAFRRN